MNFTVKNVERIWLNLPFREVPRRNMIRELPHWTIIELCRVTLENGVVGVGETMPFYTHWPVTDEAVGRATGRCATELMWDDALGHGLQMALFDAVGRTMDVPVHRLLGRKVRNEVMVSFWSIEMSPQDWLLECREALRRGYTSYKFKARPWYDLDEQLRTVCAEIPEHFEIDLDFNAMCSDSAHAVRVLCELEKYKHVKIYESPIPQDDIAGNQYLRSQTNIPIAMHSEFPPLMIALKEDLCDGFVVHGGASLVLSEAHTLATANKVFWLQMTGTELTATWSNHVAAVCTHARWPAVSCSNLYEHAVLAEPLRVEGGLVKVPEGPGLGVELNWDTVERFRIEPIPKPYPYPNLLIRVSWPSGTEDYYTHGMQIWDDFKVGRRPFFVPGVNLEVVPDDGTEQWRCLFEEADKKPTWKMRPN